MSDYTHERIPTQFVEAKGIYYAYRRFGWRVKTLKHLCIVWEVR